MGIEEFDALKQQMLTFESQIHEFLTKAQQEIGSKNELYWGTEKDKLALITTLKDKLDESKSRQDRLRIGMFLA